ncbi:MAG: radical SAM family heme chaperone HemW [Woeseia sp.]
MSFLPLSLYVHLPWCVRKCPYCDFNSHTAGAGTDKTRYLAALREDIAAESRRAGDRPVQTVFLGGGTPSLFSAAEIDQLICAIRSSLRLSDNAEITMEANPGTVERDSLGAYRQAGINRLSLGAQSFCDRSLERLGRIHTAADIIRAWREAKTAGFDNINLDLMFALPGQDVDMAVDDIRQAIALGPAHISWYQLTLEPNTVFHARPPTDLPDDELSWAMEERAQELLRDAGYRQYETSAFARPGCRCRHNLNYWQFGDYLAIGAGAHGKITDRDGQVWRYSKPAHPLTYMIKTEQGDPGHEAQRLGAGDLAFEYMLNALRLLEGFREGDFEQRTGLPWSHAAEGIERAIRLGLIERLAEAVWAPTGRGRRFLNDLQALFLPGRYSQQEA